MLGEFPRQIQALLRHVLRASGTETAVRDGQALGQRWWEAQQLVDSAPAVADRVLAQVCAEHSTPSGQHRISLGRVHTYRFASPLAELRAALEPAMALQWPHPRLQRIQDLLDEVAEQVEQVRKDQDQS